MPVTFIVKVQLSIVTTAARRQALIYTENRSLFIERDASAELIERMGDRLKVYFEAVTDDDGEVFLIREVENPGW